MYSSVSLAELIGQSHLSLLSRGLGGGELYHVNNDINRIELYMFIDPSCGNRIELYMFIDPFCG